MEFDRNAPGGGVEAKCRLENGKAFLEWRFHLRGACAQTEEQPSGIYGERNEQVWRRPLIRLFLMDGEGNVAAEGVQAVGEEEPLETVLVQPRLWQGIKDPFLYEAEAILTGGGACLDQVRTRLCLRRAASGGTGGILLNGQPLAVRAVEYSLPDAGSWAERRSQALSDVRRLLELGANSICMERRSAVLLELCDRFGFLAFEKCGLAGQDSLVCAWDDGVKVRMQEGLDGVPAYRNGTEAFFLPDQKCPTALYYKYKAKWSREPFLYMAPESVRRLKSGNYTVTCYSNCGRVALYSDGELFEFRKGDGEFRFQEIPARTPCIMLSAEGDGCSGALSLHKSFVKALTQD